MNCKVFQNLPEEAISIRTKVFMEEQGFENEFDNIDSIATHLVLVDEAMPIATARIYFSSERQSHVIGRIAVIKEWRGKELGNVILNMAEREIVKQSGNRAELSAQIRVSAFYERNGYRSLEEYHMDENCPHVWMRKELK